MYGCLLVLYTDISEYTWEIVYSCFFCFPFQVRLGYCFTPYQRLWLYNGAPLVAFYDTLGIRRTYSRLKPRRPHGGSFSEWGFNGILLSVLSLQFNILVRPWNINLYIYTSSLFCYCKHKKQFEIHSSVKPFPWRTRRRLRQLFWIPPCCVLKTDIS